MAASGGFNYRVRLSFVCFHGKMAAGMPEEFRNNSTALRIVCLVFGFFFFLFLVTGRSLELMGSDL